MCIRSVFVIGDKKLLIEAFLYIMMKFIYILLIFIAIVVAPFAASFHLNNDVSYLFDITLYSSIYIEI